uniref:Uncharacterized protein n=1 Tax=Gasterosteus aculeatus TaxID=69293 RepID=G3PLQ1_GASAC
MGNYACRMFYCFLRLKMNVMVLNDYVIGSIRCLVPFGSIYRLQGMRFHLIVRPFSAAVSGAFTGSSLVLISCWNISQGVRLLSSLHLTCI